ncbi:hypothetical protein EYW49_20465 [Siculibacillus lacustris]|uniref:Uncharacterized protein n=1 Tax=Siculibacillus lacustris TaxID=1549641 RepID=A0A4Q9VGN4_9HYPH|nr:hypothetical protein [Siculibacillus lacustris]TBW33335.1 hypothetical protein EYW49_20465 [Siculibacillus lacustris]
MPNEADSVVTMFNQMVRDGFITPVERMESLRLPGEYMYSPSIVTYGTAAASIRAGVVSYAKLDQRS